MMQKPTDQSNKFLRAIADELEVPEERYEQAEKSYKSFGEWTHRAESPVANFDPEVYIQGSFRLGTAIRPTNAADEYDIDLVCVLTDLAKHDLSQKRLKTMLQSEVQSYKVAKGIKKPVKESRRCWTLEYADGAQFHMDILPAIPDAESQRLILEKRGFDTSFAGTAIAITDIDHPSYQEITDNWPRSNPKGYYEWFKSRMAESFRNTRIKLAEAQSKRGISASVEDIPEYRVRTPLQQAVMILKRHRDDMFEHNPDIKPISIIITTLAAHAYAGESELSEALLGILSRMGDYISQVNGRFVVANPTDTTENFADRWEEYPERQVAFFKWLEQARSEFTNLAEMTKFRTMAESQTTHFTSDLRQRTLNRVEQLGVASLLGAATKAPAATDNNYSFGNAPREPKTPKDFA